MLKKLLQYVSLDISLLYNMHVAIFHTAAADAAAAATATAAADSAPYKNCCYQY